MNAKVVTPKCSRHNCTNSKSIYDTKHFQTYASSSITVRSGYVKFICDKNLQNQLIFIESYQDNYCLNRRYQRERNQVEFQLRKFVAY